MADARTLAREERMRRRDVKTRLIDHLVEANVQRELDSGYLDPEHEDAHRPYTKTVCGCVVTGGHLDPEHEEDHRASVDRAIRSRYRDVDCSIIEATARRCGLL